MAESPAAEAYEKYQEKWGKPPANATQLAAFSKKCGLSVGYGDASKYLRTLPKEGASSKSKTPTQPKPKPKPKPKPQQRTFIPKPKPSPKPMPKPSPKPRGLGPKRLSQRMSKLTSMFESTGPLLATHISQSLYCPRRGQTPYFTCASPLFGLFRTSRAPSLSPPTKQA